WNVLTTFAQRSNRCSVDRRVGGTRHVATRDPHHTGTVLINLEARSNGVVSPVVAHVERQRRTFEDRLQSFGFRPKPSSIVAENAHRRRDDGWWTCLDRTDVDSCARHLGGERRLKRANQMIRVLALRELEEELCVIGSGRLGSNRKPESRPAGADEG